MKKKILYHLILAAALFCSSCQGFLDKTPFDSIKQDEAIRNLQDARAAINGIYATWNSEGLYSGYLTLLPDVQCDFTYSVIGYSNKLGTMYTWNIIPTNEYAETMYASLYKVISDVNFLLGKKEDIELQEGQQEELNNLLGEAYFSRALAYSELAKTYCPAYDPDKAEQQAGVSIWNTFLAGKPERSTLAKTYSQIFDDLEQAGRLLSYDAADAIRISRGALDALYARVYLYMHNWEEAAKAATRVIDNPHYALAEGYTDVDTLAAQTEFNTLWEYDKSNEIIWKLEYTKNNLAGSLGSYFCGTLGGFLRIDYAPAVGVVNLYAPQDVRKDVYFKTGNVNGSPIPVITKYPGNPDLRPSTAHVFCNMPKVFRLAEMYLIRAEAYANDNQESLANADLKTLRSKRIKNYEHVTANGKILQNEIRQERIKELYMEGHRLYDLKRYGEGFTRTSQSQSISPEDKLTISAGDYRFLWPIPSHEMDANRNMKQNPGY